jgi:signal transduction histidine kinase
MELPVATRNLLSGRAGQIALIVALALAAAYEASLPSAAPGGFARSTAILLNVLAVVPLLLARRWPSVAAAAATLVTVAILRAYDAPLAVASFSVMVIVLTQLVVRRGLLLAAPLLLPFVVFAVERLDAGRSALGSTAPLLFLIAALAVGESVRRRRLAVAALDATQEAMAESTRARTLMQERARIARELHDSVAHHLSVIAIESEAARLAASSRLPPPRGRRSRRPAGCSASCARTPEARPTEHPSPDSASSAT